MFGRDKRLGADDDRKGKRGNGKGWNEASVNLACA